MGGQIFETLAFQHQTKGSRQLQISILETPAGFEVNAQRVAGRVADFLKTRLQNYHPDIRLVAARKRGTPFSPDAPEIAQPLYNSQMIFFGPGSPTYTIRQLENSLAWQVIQARHRLGADLVLASAAIIAVSALALPVYEIYKVGEEPFWRPGLNLLQPYGLSLAIIPHWNNREGGDEVDTSRCFMGQERFAVLRHILPSEMTILGIDEHTALTLDLQSQTCIVRGVGQVHIQQGSYQEECAAGCSFPINALGNYHPLLNQTEGLPEAVWQKAVQETEQNSPEMNQAEISVPSEILRLVDERQAARHAKNWALADQLRGQIINLGWQVKDTPAGPQINRGE